jgi:Cytochrome c554 and c-prime
VIAAAGCTGAKRDETSQRGSAAPSAPVRRPVTRVGDDRNVTAADYIGPAACAECHEPQYALWRASMHRVMNARADEPGAVVGDFANARVPHNSGEVRMETDLVGRTMITTDRERTVRYRVTRTIGKRGLQEYVGIEDGHSEEVRLPFGWWPRLGGWAPQSAFDPWLDETHFDAFAPVRESWAERCPWCHSTYPFAQRIARGSGGRAIGHGLEQFYTSAPASPRLDVAAQVTTGISCESCHLGGRAHAAGAPIQFLPRGAALRDGAPNLPATFAEQKRDARVVNTVCAQCHSGPSPRLADGTALRNSSEALDLASSSCTTATCTDCHDPHRADGQPDEARAIAACVRCHATQSAPTHAGAGHTASAAAATATCLDCHMPKLVMGIDRYVRTHRISSPTNPKLLAEAAPNACNLCHLDRSIDWTLTELRLGWEVKLALPRGRVVDGESVGDVWLASSSPAIRLIAAHAYARSPLGPFALTTLRTAQASDPLPYVRAWMQFAVEDITR